MIYFDLLLQFIVKKSVKILQRKKAEKVFTELRVISFFVGKGRGWTRLDWKNTHKSQGKGHVAENPARVGVRTTPLAPLGAKT